jgi:uncharacterized protein (TIGR02246 family)
MVWLKTRAPLMLGLALLLGCARPHPAAPAAAPAGLNELTSAFVAAFNAGDAERLGTLYDDDAVLMPASGEILRGGSAIRGFWKRFLEQGTCRVQLSVASSSESGGQGYVGGTFELDIQRPGAVANHDNGQFVNVTRKLADGRWRVVYAIYNSLPPARP